MDEGVRLVALEPAAPAALARECMVKTRRRKGLSEEVSVGKYFDDPLMMALREGAEGSQ